MNDLKTEQLSLSDALLNICVQEFERVLDRERKGLLWETKFGENIDSVLMDYSMLGKPRVNDR